jgi:hypothetical protein
MLSSTNSHRVAELMREAGRPSCSRASVRLPRKKSARNVLATSSPWTTSPLSSPLIFAAVAMAVLAQPIGLRSLWPACVAALYLRKSSIRSDPFVPISYEFSASK